MNYLFETMVDLRKCNDSLLFSNGATIASLAKRSKNENELILKVNGETEIKYYEGIYRYAGQFPDRLKQLIRQGEEDGYEVLKQNWFEFVYRKDKKDIHSFVCEIDIDCYTCGDLMEYMIKMLNSFIKE